MPATAAYVISRLAGAEFSMGAHAYDVFRLGGDWLLSIKLEKAKFVRTSSRSTARRLTALGLSHDKCRLVRRSLEQRPMRKKFEPTNPGRVSMLSVGRLVEKKGYFHQLGIARELHLKGIPFELNVIGSGVLLPELILESKRIGVNGKVRFLGSLPLREVWEHYMRNDLFVFTGVIDSRGDRDGIPNVVLEALAAGMLVLSSNQAGASEPVVDGVNGFSLSPFNPNLWVDKVIEFWKDPSRFDEIRRKGRIAVEKEFDCVANGKALMELFEDHIQ